MLDRLGKISGWCALGIRIANGFFANAHGLKVHAEYGWNASAIFASRGFAIDFIDDGGNFRIVIGSSLCSRISDSTCRIDFRNKQVINTFARWAVDDFVSRVLVAPGGVHSGGFGHFKNGVHAQELVGINRLAAISAITRQFGFINAATAIDGIGVLVD